MVCNPVAARWVLVLFTFAKGFAADPNYPCCNFRGSVVALDLNTGAILWKTYMVPPTYSGGAVWGSTPVVDLKRRSLYSQFAASKGVSPQDVGITAGCQLLARVGVGEAYMWADGAWRRRTPGKPAPVPDYCH